MQPGVGVGRHRVVASTTLVRSSLIIMSFVAATPVVVVRNKEVNTMNTTDGTLKVKLKGEYSRVLGRDGRRGR